MKRGFCVSSVIVLSILCMMTYGCRAKEKPITEEGMGLEETGVAPITEEMGEGMMQEFGGVTQVETIPPTASVPEVTKPVSVIAGALTRDKEIQTALKAAGFYTGAIDGKIGPKTKKAIEDFQRANGLVVDGKVGPKTWAEMEKYLARQ